MGKIRVKTFGDEDQEQKDKLKAQKRAEAKKLAQQNAAANNPDVKTEAPEKEQTETGQQTNNSESENKKQKTDSRKTVSKQNPHSKHYREVIAHVDKNKKYNLPEALTLLEKIKLATFDETVELHINTNEKGISGNVTLPHGTGKETRIAIANATEDAKHVEELVKKIEAGKIDFDVLIATPDSMAKLAKVARILGPKGLMPNPKNGTVTPKPDEIAKKFAGGQVNFKTEAKFPILHLAVGKLSFGDKKLNDNITTAIKAVKTKNIKNITLKSTMSPGIKIEATTI